MKEADPVVRRNRIFAGKSSGIYVHKGGRGTYEDNEIVGNGKAGITIESTGAPVVRRNRINKNAYEAVWVMKDGAGVFVDNDLRENLKGPWDIHKEALGQVTRERNLES